MHYDRISADCHLDLCCAAARSLHQPTPPAAMRDRMPYVTDGPKGPMWVTKKGATSGLANGMGSAGREYVPGQHPPRRPHGVRPASTRTASSGIRRLTEPELRLKDQDRDGVQAEVLYGILGASSRINDPEAVGEMMRGSTTTGSPTSADAPRALRRARLHPERAHRRAPIAGGGARGQAGRGARASTSPTPRT